MLSHRTKWARRNLCSSFNRFSFINVGSYLTPHFSIYGNGCVECNMQHQFVRFMSNAPHSRALGRARSDHLFPIILRAAAGSHAGAMHILRELGASLTPSGMILLLQCIAMPSRQAQIQHLSDVDAFSIRWLLHKVYDALTSSADETNLHAHSVLSCVISLKELLPNLIHRDRHLGRDQEKSQTLQPTETSVKQVSEMSQQMWGAAIDQLLCKIKKYGIASYNPNQILTLIQNIRTTDENTFLDVMNNDLQRLSEVAMGETERMFKKMNIQGSNDTCQLQSSSSDFEQTASSKSRPFTPDDQHKSLNDSLHQQHDPVLAARLSRLGFDTDFDSVETMRTNVKDLLHASNSNHEDSGRISGSTTPSSRISSNFTTETKLGQYDTHWKSPDTVFRLIASVAQNEQDINRSTWCTGQLNTHPLLRQQVARYLIDQSGIDSQWHASCDRRAMVRARELSNLNLRDIICVINACLEETDTIVSGGKNNFCSVDNSNSETELNTTKTSDLLPQAQKKRLLDVLCFCVLARLNRMRELRSIPEKLEQLVDFMTIQDLVDALKLCAKHSYYSPKLCNAVYQGHRDLRSLSLYSYTNNQLLDILQTFYSMSHSHVSVLRIIDTALSERLSRQVSGMLNQQNQSRSHNTQVQSDQNCVLDGTCLTCYIDAFDLFRLHQKGPSRLLRATSTFLLQMNEAYRSAIQDRQQTVHSNHTYDTISDASKTSSVFNIQLKQFKKSDVASIQLLCNEAFLHDLERLQRILQENEKIPSGLMHHLRRILSVVKRKERTVTG